MQTPNVFIDSCVFIGHNYDYDSKVFRQIISLAEEKKVFVYVTRIVVNEIEAHIDEDVLKAQEAFNGFREKADVRILKNIEAAPLYGVFNGFDVMQAKEVLLTQFRNFLTQAKVQVLEITGVSVDDVFDRYFSQTPPFGSKKKHEFPDAFSLAAVEKWCKELSTKMYVISGDSDWRDACALNPSLISVQSLSEFLDLLSREEKLAELANRLFDEHKAVILDRIKIGVAPLNLVYEPYGELQSAVVDSARIVKHYLIEVEETKAVFDVVTEVSYSAIVLYRNNGLLLTMDVFGQTEETAYGSTNVRAEVTLVFNETSGETTVESVNITHDNIPVFPDEEPEQFLRKFARARRALSKHVAVIAQLMDGATWILTNTPEAILERFDDIKNSLPVLLMSDLQTLSMLNSVTGGLNYYGATTIKDQTSRRSNVSNIRMRNPFTHELDAVTRSALAMAKKFDSFAVRQAMQNAELLNRPAIQRAIEEATVFNSSAVQQILADSKRSYVSAVQRAVEDATLFTRPAVQRAIEEATVFNSSAVQQILADSKRSYVSAVQRALEDATLLTRPAIQRAFEDAKVFSTSAVQRAIESREMLYKNPLSGHSLPRYLLLDIFPRTSNVHPPDEPVRTLEVEVLRNADVYGSSDTHEKTEEDDWDETSWFEFNQSPITIGLNHKFGGTKSRKTQHRLRRPSLDQWQQWGMDLQRSIRYLTQEEIEEEWSDKETIDGDSVVSTQSYSEWRASERLYDELILEIAGLRLDKEDQFPLDQFRALPSETIKKLRTEIKVNIVTRLYECYCDLERFPSSNANEHSVRQYLEFDSTPFNVRHVLRNPTPEEGKEFRTSVVKGSFSRDEENREIVELHLNLATAVTFYDRLLIRVENGTVDGHPYDDSTRESFLLAINPVYKLRVLEPLFDVNAWYFKIDDMIIP
jgi:hypothetical protein